METIELPTFELEKVLRTLDQAILPVRGGRSQLHSGMTMQEFLGKLDGENQRIFLGVYVRGS